MLLIRTIKARPLDTVRRLCKIWRMRCLLPEGYDPKGCESYLTYHLMELIIDNDLCVKPFVHLLCTEDDNRFDTSRFNMQDHVQNKLARVASHLALMKVSDIPNFIIPARFKNL